MEESERLIFLLWTTGSIKRCSLWKMKDLRRRTGGDADKYPAPGDQGEAIA